MLRLARFNSNIIVSDYINGDWHTDVVAYDIHGLAIRPEADYFLITAKSQHMRDVYIIDRDGRLTHKPQWTLLCGNSACDTLFVNNNNLCMTSIDTYNHLSLIDITGGKYYSSEINIYTVMSYNPFVINGGVCVAGIQDKHGHINVINVVPHYDKVYMETNASLAVTGPTCVSVYNPTTAMVYMRDTRAELPEQISVYHDVIPDSRNMYGHNKYTTCIMSDGNVASLHVYRDGRDSCVTMIDMRSPMEHYDMPAPDGVGPECYVAFANF